MDREVKNAKIKETYALTRERRMSQIPPTFRMKVRNEKMNKRVGVFDAWTNINEILKDPINIIAIRKKFPDDDFIIFSDDIEWCKDVLAGLNFQFRQESKIVDTNKIGYSERIDSDQFIDLVAMSQCYATITDDSLLAWVSAWISERPGHITAYKENAFEDVLIPSDDKTWMTFDKFLAI